MSTKATDKIERPRPITDPEALKAHRALVRQWNARSTGFSSYDAPSGFLPLPSDDDLAQSPWTRGWESMALMRVPDRLDRDTVDSLALQYPDVAMRYAVKHMSPERLARVRGHAAQDLERVRTANAFWATRPPGGH